MTEDEILISQIKDKWALCQKDMIITSTDFLDLRKQSVAVSFLRRQGEIRWELYGGFDGAERKTVVFLPYYVDDLEAFLNDSPESSPLVVFRADKDSFSNLSHRDYLGALTGMGIKREKLGDIIVDEKGCYFFSKESISRYILENFNSAGRGTLKISKVDEKVDFSKNINIKELCCFVATPRLDAVIGGIFSLSRSKACEAIERGLVFVNDEQILKPDSRVKSGDKVVFKGKGRAKIKDDSSKSKKGRTALIVDMYI